MLGGLNRYKRVAGYYVDSANNSHGFLFKPPHTFKALNYPGGTGTFAYGINDSGEIVGTWFDASLNQHGFTFAGGTFTSFDIPGSTGTNPIGVNNGGDIVGYFFDSSNVEHGFKLAGGITGTFTQIDYPGSSFTSVDRELNTLDGDLFPGLVGLYADALGNIHGFGVAFFPDGDLFSMLDVINIGGATDTRIRGIADAAGSIAAVAGRFTDKNGVIHCFRGIADGAF